MKYKYLAPIAGTLCLAACVPGPVPTGPAQYDSRAVERDQSELVSVNLEMGAGDLKVGSGTSKLAQAYFTYNIPSWKPVVDYSPGNLTIRQPGRTHSHLGNLKYEWDVRLGQKIPLDLKVHFGPIGHPIHT